MNKKTYYYTVSLIFFVVAIGHALRLYSGWAANIGGVDIPLWVSWAGILLAGYLGVRGWMFATNTRK